MKICYLCPDLGIPIGGTKGAAAHVRGLVAGLAELGHRIHVLSPEPDGATEADPSPDARRDPGPGATTGAEPETSMEPGTGSRTEARVSFERIPIPPLVEGLRPSLSRPLARALAHLWTNVTLEATLERRLVAFQPDVVYERYSPFSVAGGAVAGRFGLPHLLEVNSPLAWEGRTYRRQALEEAAEGLERAALKNASLVVAVSEELRRTLVEVTGLPHRRITVVPNGVDVGLFRPGRPAFEGLRGRFVLGFVGSLKPWHGIQVLIEAFRHLAPDPRFHLLVVGDGPERAVVEELEREWPGRVTRPGAVSQREVAWYVGAMDVALAPYPPLERFYYSPLKVLEYMAAGRAVVCSRIGQLSRLLRHGETGLLVPPGDPMALAAAVRALAADDDLRRTLGRAAAREARERHSWRDRAGRVVELAGALARGARVEAASATRGAHAASGALETADGVGEAVA